MSNMPENKVPTDAGADTDRIIATRIEEARRVEFLLRVFPTRIGGMPGWMWGESTVYAYASKLCETYTGGFWNYCELSNGGFYMAPDGDEKVHVAWADNFYSGDMSPDAFGIVALIFTLNAAWDRTQDDRFIYAMDHLKDFAAQHEERRAIFAAID